MTKPNDPLISDDEGLEDEDLINALWTYDELLSVELPPGVDAEKFLKATLAPDTLTRFDQNRSTIQLLSDAAASLLTYSQGASLGFDSSQEAATPTFAESGAKHLSAVFSRAADHPGETEQLPKSFGRFELVRELGRGGLGVVLLAHDPVLHRDVALKIPRPEALLTPDLRARFLREAQAAARLTHPNIVTVYEVGQVGAITYIAAAFCQGTNLAEWLHTRQNAVSAKQAAQIVALLADGIAYAHRHGVLHRDLKPSNVLLEGCDPMLTGDIAPGDAGCTPKISDFGLARIQDTDGGDTRAGVVMGTPNYMAPEQAQGSTSQIGKASDIYGLGAILYELLVGHPPFRGTSDADVLCQVVGTEAARPHAIRPDLPRDLEAICLKCLEKKPQARYKAAEDLAADLRRFLAGEPTDARPLSALQRIAKWSYRRPALAALVVSSGLFVLMLSGGSAAYSWRLSHALNESEDRRIEADSLRLAAESSRQDALRQRDDNAELVYGARMHQGYQALANGYVKQVKRSLAEYEDGAELAGLRGFDWYYLKLLTHGERLLLSGHQGEVYGVAFSPDGRVLASAAADGLIKLWDPINGHELRTIKAHSSCANDLAFSPDGRLLASGSCDGTVKLWDTLTWGVVASFDCGPNSKMTCLDFSPDGRLLAAGDDHSGVFTVWNVASAERVTRIDTDGSESLMGLDVVKWSPDGSRLATSHFGREAQLWDTESWEKKDAWIANSRTLAFSADSRRIIAHGNEGNGIRIRELESASERFFPYGVIGSVYKVALSGDGLTLFVSDEQNVRIWRLGSDGYPVAGAPPRLLIGHEGRVQSLSLSPDGKSLATASFDGTVRVWDVSAWRDEVPLLRTNARAAVLSPDLDRATVFVDDRLVTWDLSASKPTILSERPLSPLDKSHFYGFSPAAALLTALRPSDGQLFELKEPDESRHFTPVSWQGSYARLPKFSRDSRLVAADTLDEFTRVYDTQTAAEIYAAKHPYDEETIRQLRTGSLCEFSDDNRKLAIMCVGERIIDLRTGAATEIHRDSEGMPVCAMRLNCDGALLVIAQSNGALQIIDTATGRTLRSMRTSNYAEALAITPDGRTLATALYDGRVILWHVPTGQELGTFSTGSGGFQELRFSTDGRALGAVIFERPANLDARVHIWSCRDQPR